MKEKIKIRIMKYKIMKYNLYKLQDHLILQLNNYKKKNCMIKIKLII